VHTKDILGFNYSGSWGTSGLDLWLNHNTATMAIEVARGKEYFPRWNVARWWLSHEAFQRDPAAFLANFDAGLEVFAANGIAVMPVLFNRWRDPVCDFGGVPLDHIVPGFSVHGDPADFTDATRHGAPTSIDSLFRIYTEAVVAPHATDARIHSWDLCNEPLMGTYVADPTSPVRAAEVQWLTWTRDIVRGAGATQPITVGNYLNSDAIILTEPLSDFISFHPYYVPADKADGPVTPDPKVGTKAAFEGFLDEVVDIATRAGKTLVASETVWGAVDDAEHVAIAEYTLGALKERGIGFIVHALHHSLVADLHSAEHGPVGPPGRLEFIEADGTLRAGHEIFNSF
jgi:hypothetical protein